MDFLQLILIAYNHMLSISHMAHTNELTGRLSHRYEPQADNITTTTTISKNKNKNNINLIIFYKEVNNL